MDAFYKISEDEYMGYRFYEYARLCWELSKIRDETDKNKRLPIMYEMEILWEKMNDGQKAKLDILDKYYKNNKKPHRTTITIKR